MHSFCHRQMGKGYVVDNYNLQPFMEDFGLDLEDGGTGAQYVQIMSRARSKMVPISQEVEKLRTFGGTWPHFQSFCRSYDMWKKEHGYIDFSDMLDRYLNCKRGTNLRLLAVDEAQDLTPLHWKVIRHVMTLNPDCRVLVAGDEDQSIYAYMGADPLGIHAFHDEFKTAYQVLEQSYRVPRVVHAVASRVIDRIKNRVRVVYKPREAEGRCSNFADAGYITKQLKAGKDNLILYSDRFIRDEIERDLISDLVPYTVVSGLPGPLDIKAGRVLKLAISPPPGNAEDWAERRAFIKSALSKHGAAIWDSVGHLAVMARLVKRDLTMLRVRPAHQDYLYNVDLSQPVETRLSTIHGAKGREGEIVHLSLGQSSAASLQSLDSPDNQHRLFYVGVTRAREELVTYEGTDNGYDIHS